MRGFVAGLIVGITIAGAVAKAKTTPAPIAVELNRQPATISELEWRVLRENVRRALPNPDAQIIVSPTLGVQTAAYVPFAALTGDDAADEKRIRQVCDGEAERTQMAIFGETNVPIVVKVFAEDVPPATDRAAAEACRPLREGRIATCSETLVASAAAIRHVKACRALLSSSGR